MKKFTVLLISITILLVVWACTDLDHSNPFDPDWGVVTALTNVNLEIKKIDQIQVTWDSDYLNKDGYTFQIDRKIGDGEWFEKYKLFTKDTYYFTDSIAAMNETNYYRVRVGYDENLSSPVEASVFNPFPAPANLIYSKIDISTFKLNWDDNSNGEDGFVIDRAVNGIWTDNFASVESNITTWTDLNAPINSTLSYKLSAIRRSFQSIKDSTNTISNMFPPPTNVVITQISPTNIKIDWSDNSIGEDGFKIDKKSDDGTWVNGVAVLGENTTTWTDDSAVVTDSLQYRLYAYKGTDASDYIFSNATDLSFPPPSDIKITHNNLHSIKLEWSDNSFIEDGFKIDKKVGNNDWVVKYGIVPENIKNWTDASAEINQIITYRIYGYNATQNTSYAFTPEIDNSIPAPTNLIGSLNEMKITLTWDDNSEGEDGFKIDRKIGNGIWEEDYANVGENIEIWYETVADTGKYYYRVKGFYSNEVSAFSDVAEITNQITFIINYGGEDNEQGRCLSFTSQGGYIIGGFGNSDIEKKQVLLFTTDKVGNITNEKTFDRINCNDQCQSILRTSDNCYLLGCYSYSYDTNHSLAWVIKINENCDEIWNNTYGDSLSESCNFIIETIDECYTLGGYTYSYSDHNDGDAWLLKMNSNGDVLWSKTYGDTLTNTILSIYQSIQGDYYLLGQSYGQLDIPWIKKTDELGNEIWTKQYVDTLSNKTYIIDFSKTNDGGFVLTGSKQRKETLIRDICLIKINNLGDIEWSKTFDNPSNDFSYSVCQTNDDGYIIVGNTDEANKTYNLVLLKTDSFGNEEWKKIYSEGWYGTSIKQTIDNGYILTGYSSISGKGQDVLLMKTDANGNILDIK